MWYDNGVLRDPAPLMHPSIPHPPHVYPMPYLGHTVKKGQTPKEIADLYGVEVEKLLAINGMKPSETLHAGWRIIIPKKIKQKKYAKGLYKVKKGDTLAAIAVLYDVKVAELQALNGIDDPDLIKPGTRIKLPKGVYSGKAMEPIGGGDDGPGKEGYKKYVVKEGDSLFSIAKKFKSSIKKIAAANGISNPDMIKPDMKLLVPYEKKKHSKAGHGKKKKKKSGIKKEGKETEELGDDEGAGHGEEEPDEEGEEGSGDEAEDGEEPGPEETGGGREDGGGAGSGDQDVIPAKEKVMELKRIGGSKSKNMEVYVIE
jgi:LysM repeat protein